MKRLFLFLFVWVLAAACVFAAGMPVAAAKTRPNTSAIMVDELIGKSISQVAAEFGKPARVDASEFAFNWHVFNGDYKRFLMAGVDGGTVVAVYCNSQYLLSKGAIKIGTDRAMVRELLGAPITTKRIGNTVYVFPNTDRKDIFLIDGYYYYYYYDVFNKYKVTSVMIVKQEYEEELLGKPLALSDAAAAAYSRQSADLVNSIRARNGLNTLSHYGKAAAFALTRSEDMRDRAYFSHYTPEGNSPAFLARKYGITYRTLCENIAYGHRNAINAFEAFMNSKGHRKNILNKVKQIGVGTAAGGDRSVIVTYTLLIKK